MKSVFSLLIALLVISACGSASNPEEAINSLQPNSDISDIQIESIAQTLSYYPNHTQLAIAFVDDSMTTFYGTIRRNDSLKTIENSEKVFEIGSLSKVFTSTLLADFAVKKSYSLISLYRITLIFRSMTACR